MKWFKQYLLGLLLVSCTSFVMANNVDTNNQLFKAAGWPVQIDHFNDALQAMQKQYQAVLPPLLYQSIVVSSNQRFEPSAMKQKGELQLRNKLADPDAALKFFESDLGKKVVHAETTATTKEELKKHQNGVPAIEISNDRRNLFKHLAEAIPYNQATVEVSVALTGIASDTIDMWLPGMGAGDAFKQITPTKQQIQKQVDTQLENVLVYVYRDLSDAELQQFIKFAESSTGKDYYQVAQDIVLACVNK